MTEKRQRGLRRALVRSAVATAAIGALQIASADTLEINFENVGGDTDFVLTPLWVGLHDGSFDLFDSGAPASPGLVQIAETGDATTLTMEFDMAGRRQLAGIGNAMGFGGAPVVEGGETATGEIAVSNPSAYRWLTFASMVIPSNDAFIGNDDPLAYEIFAADGSFVGPPVIEIFGGEIWDAGSEVNDGLGAAFSATGGVDTDEGGTVMLHPGLDNLVGTMTAAGATIGQVPGPDDLIARISFAFIPDPVVLPLPGPVLLIGFAALGLLRRRGR